MTVSIMSDNILDLQFLTIANDKKINKFSEWQKVIDTLKLKNLISA